MNKYQEALEFLRSENVTAWGNDNFELLYFHLDNIEELVDKATPKKPIKHYYKSTSFIFVKHQSIYTCPRCGNACLKHYTENERNENNYCYDCGQKLDWSDEND